MWTEPEEERWMRVGNRPWLMPWRRSAVCVLVWTAESVRQTPLRLRQLYNYFEEKDHVFTPTSFFRRIKWTVSKDRSQICLSVVCLSALKQWMPVCYLYIHGMCTFSTGFTYMILLKASLICLYTPRCGVMWALCKAHLNLCWKIQQ